MMTDQYKELRQAALCQGNKAWAKQALQLLAEMDAVGAGGVSGKSIRKGRSEDLGDVEIGNALCVFNYPFDGVTKGCFKVGYDYAISQMQEWGPWTGKFEAIPGELVELEGTPGLREWVELILMADDATKDILRQGLKEEIELMFSKAVDHPSAYSQNKWVGWSGGENPVPGHLVDFKLDGGTAVFRSQSQDIRWTNEGGGDVTSYRVVK